MILRAATLLALLLAGCGGPTTIDLDHAWMRLPAVAGRPAAAYFTLHGGPVDKTLIGVTTDVTLRSDMHESMRGGQGMAPLKQVPVPAGSTITFAPGGRHVMLYGVNPIATPGSNVLLTLTFADGTRLTRTALVVGAGDPAPE